MYQVRLPTLSAACSLDVAAYLGGTAASLHAAALDP
jgi:hypothetical protein